MEGAVAACTRAAPHSEGRDSAYTAADGRCGGTPRCRNFAVDSPAGKGIGAGGVETVDTADGLVGEVDEPFVAHYVCSSERSGDAQAFCHGLFNDTSGVVRGGFEASG